METFPLVLVIASTLMHAAWNILSRYQGGAQTNLRRMQVSIVVLGAIPAFISLMIYPSISMKAVLCLVGSGVCCGFYFFCLGRGYDSGDFTTVYPAARALPVLILGIGDVIRGRPPSLLGWVAMLIVAVGCLMVPLNSFSDIRLKHYFKPATIWIFFIALGTVGYSLFDKIGTESIPTGPREAAVYCYLFFLMTFISYVLMQIIQTRHVKRRPEAGWGIPVMAGMLCFLGYWLVLSAYQMTDRVSYVVAFRQFSIVIGVIAALIVFNESGKFVRLVGSVVITAGLLILKMYGD